jgi:hypothetical protein
MGPKSRVKTRLALELDVGTQLGGALLWTRDHEELAAARAKGASAGLLAGPLAKRVHTVGERISCGVLDLLHDVRVAVVDNGIGAERSDQVEILERSRCHDPVTPQVRELDREEPDGCSPGVHQNPGCCLARYALRHTRELETRLVEEGLNARQESAVVSAAALHDKDDDTNPQFMVEASSKDVASGTFHTRSASARAYSANAPVPS